MELSLRISLSDGAMYPDTTSANRDFEVNLPWEPGNHNAETALVEAISSIVNFGEVIGELHEELTAKFEEKLHKKMEEEQAKAMQEVSEMQAAMEQSGTETAERQKDDATHAGDTEVPQ